MRFKIALSLLAATAVTASCQMRSFDNTRLLEERDTFLVITQIVKKQSARYSSQKIHGNIKKVSLFVISLKRRLKLKTRK